MRSTSRLNLSPELTLYPYLPVARMSRVVRSLPEAKNRSVLAPVPPTAKWGSEKAALWQVASDLPVPEAMATMWWSHMPLLMLALAPSLYSRPAWIEVMKQSSHGLVTLVAGWFQIIPFSRVAPSIGMNAANGLLPGLLTLGTVNGP